MSPLFKKNDALNKSNYKPVSVLIALSKIYEKAVSIQVTDHFNSIVRPYFRLSENDIVVNQRY